MDEVYILFAGTSSVKTMSGQKIKIVLVSPKGPLYRHRGGIWRKSLRYQPLTLTTLAALMPPELAVELELFDEGITGCVVGFGSGPRRIDRHHRHGEAGV